MLTKNGFYINVLMPHNLKKFKCTGKACEDNCCKGWKITVDKDTYYKYKSYNKKDFKYSFKENVILNNNKNKNNYYSYGIIRLDEHNECPFLEEEGLCKIHKNLGEKYLSVTCVTYPRKYNLVDGVLEISAQLSCPEFARAILLDKEKMCFDYEENVFYERNIGSGDSIDCLKPRLYGDQEKYFWDFRDFIIDLIQDRNFTIDERLIILGLFIKRADEYIRNERSQDIINLISSYKEILKIKDNLTEKIFNITVNFDVQIYFIKSIMKLRNQCPIMTTAFKQCNKEFLEGIKYNENDIEKTINEYKKAYEEFYKPEMRRFEYIFENYIVNFIFSSLFPLHKSNVFIGYSDLVIKYAFIRVYLIGISAYNKGLNEEHIIKLIYSFSREFDNFQDFYKRLNAILSESDLQNIDYMTALIKI